MVYKLQMNEQAVVNYFNCSKFKSTQQIVLRTLMKANRSK